VRLEATAEGCPFGLGGSREWKVRLEPGQSRTWRVRFTVPHLPLFRPVSIRVKAVARGRRSDTRDRDTLRITIAPSP